VAYANRLRVMFCNADEDPEKEAFYLEMMRDENVAGVILSPTLPLLARYKAADYPFPMVLVDRCNSMVEADAVVLDNMDASLRLTRHLIECGHRRIAFFYGAGSATGQQRFDGYLAALGGAGLTPISHALKPTVEEARTSRAPHHAARRADRAWLKQTELGCRPARRTALRLALRAAVCSAADLR